MQLLIPNVALNGEATQSSSYHHTIPPNSDSFDDPDDAHYAVDGKFGTLLTSGDRCAITKADAGTWWQVNLKYQFKIEKVAVTTRECCEYHSVEPELYLPFTYMLMTFIYISRKFITI